MRRESRARLFLAAAAVWCLSLAAPATAQFVPYFGKNKVKYQSFAWRVYRSPHFEVYYYPELEEHLGRVVSYAESGYQKISSSLKHTIGFPIPLVLYKTHADFEQTALFPTFLPEGVAAFAEPTRHRMVLPIDEAPDRLYGLVTHELTHIFEFDLIPRGFGNPQVPLWVDEGLADHMRELWDPLDLMTVREAAVTDQVPRLSRLDEAGAQSPNPRLIYNVGHAAFEYIEARYGKEGIRQFLYALRKTVAGNARDELFRQAFRVSATEFDDAFDKWLKERFKPYRDRQPATDYGRDLAPDAEKTAYTQVFAFSPSPSGELIAAITGNRSDGEADIVLLSARDGSVVRNLTKGFAGQYESLSFNDGFTAGRSIAFSPDGDHVAFVARTGRGRRLFFVSVLSGKLERSVPVALDLPQAPCPLPDGRRVLLAGIREGVSDIFLLDVLTGRLENLTRDEFRDGDPQVSPDGAWVVYTRRISGHDKLMVLSLAAPEAKTQLTFGAFDDLAPSFSPDGKAVFYSSDEDDEILNVRALDLTTGAIRQYTDALGGNLAPAILRGRETQRIAFISYAKGLYRLQAIEPQEPLKEVEQEIVQADVEPVDFQAETKHQILTENKRGKRLFEKFVLEGRPPINVGFTSSGDFFGGSQAAFSDVLGDKNLVLSVLSEREFRSYDMTYVNLAHRLHWGLSGFDTTLWGYADPYGYLTYGFNREGALLTRRFSGVMGFGVYPLDKLRRLELSAGLLRESTGFPSAQAAAFVQEQASLYGLPSVTRSGTTLPLSLTLVQETTRFQEFGPMAGSTFSLGLQCSPGWSRSLSRLTVDVDARKYFRLLPGTVFALRARGFRSAGDDPDYFFFGGNMELRGFDYRSLSGTEAFFANAELRFPIVDLMKTPLGILGPLRGTLFAGVGGSRWYDGSFRFGTRQDGLSYVNDAVFGEPVTGYHLVDARASFGWGLQLFFLGLPLHLDWTRFTDLKVVSGERRLTFWVGYDF